MQLGAALRDLALQMAIHEGVTEVVAMTRCSHFDSKHTGAQRQQAYAEYVARAQDPGLRFHLGGARAATVAVVQGYRTADVNNCGNAVLCSYDLTKERPAHLSALHVPRATAAGGSMTAPPAARPATSEQQTSEQQTSEQTSDAFARVLSRIGEDSGLGRVAYEQCADQPLMDIGFDSFAVCPALLRTL